jgi:predicted amidohydrolase YtcJ
VIAARSSSQDQPSDPARWWLRRVSPAPGVVIDLGLADGRLVDPAGLGPDARVVDLAGRPVLAGLVDQHCHLFALHAGRRSIDLSPEALAQVGGLTAALQRGRVGQSEGWLRAVDYDVATSGAIDAATLDAAAVGPVRVQDRTGITWTLDPTGLAEVLPADPQAWPEGVERDGAGHPTGRLFRLDAWLRTRLEGDRLVDQPSAGAVAPDLADLGRWLAARGVTTVVDASATNDAEALRRLAGAGLPQRIVAMTAAPDTQPSEGLSVGAVKILLDDADLPTLDDLTTRVMAAHAAGRQVAVHCVTAVQLVLALSAGLARGDRIEHGSVIDQGALALVASAGVVVVTQPGLIVTRGDRYWREVDDRDRAGLYRLASLLRAGIPVALGTDAPYGPADPWVHLAAAQNRRTAEGRVVGTDEAVSLDDALGLFQRDPLAPGRPGPGLVGGAPGDLCVLDTDWTTLEGDASAVEVHATWIGGQPVHGPAELTG